MAMKVLIIGGGVIGLTTAWVMLEKGFDVIVIAKEYVGGEKLLTSEIAGALWEWPPAVCGTHTNEISLEKSKAWCQVAYKRFKNMASLDVGISIKMSNFFFKEHLEDNDYQFKKMKEIEAHVEGFRRDAKIIKELNINPNYGLVDAYQHLAPIIDTPKYMQFLTSYLRNRCDLLIHTIEGDLLDIEDQLLNAFNVDIIVNCADLGSKELANDDTMVPLRGALVRVINGKNFSIIKEAMSVSLDGREAAPDMVYIIPRNDEILLLGGFAQLGKWNIDLNMENYPLITDMFKRSQHFYPPLQKACLDESCPVVVGLRPYRLDNVCLEREGRRPNSRIIHNYGHGGSGFSFSFGCAEDVARIAESIVKGT